jgi:MFS family permease
MSSSTPQSTNSAERRKVVAATIVGTTIEWYDFFIYAFAANLVFAPLFFEPAGPQVGMLISLLTIGLSFLFRPLGAFLAGHYGDKIGRRPMLVLTLLLMGGATTLVGVLPTYASAGLFAPIALIFLRILQGISAGGEWGGAVLMSVEHAPVGRRGRYGVFPQLGVPLGMILASGVLAIMRAVAPGDAFLSWGWRIPFLLSIFLIVVGYVVRRTVEESPIFAEIARAREQQSAPIKEVFRRHWPLVLLSALIFAGNNACGYMTTGGYIQGMASRPGEEGGLGFNPVAVQVAVLGAAAVWFCSTLLSGWMADRFGRKTTYLIGWVILAFSTLPLFPLVQTGAGGIFAGASLMAVGLGLTYGPQAALYAETFPASVRFSGVAISYAIGAILGGAFAPTIAEALLQRFGTTWAIPPYLIGMVIIAAVATVLIKERRDIPLGIEFEQSGQWQDWQRESSGSPAK